MEELMSLTKMFEENGQSSDWYRSVFAKAALVLLNESDKICSKSREAITGALDCLDELIETCDVMMLNERIAEAKKLEERAKGFANPLGAINRLSELSNDLEKIVCEVEAIGECEKVDIEEFTDMADKTEKALLALQLDIRLKQK